MTETQPTREELFAQVTHATVTIAFEKIETDQGSKMIPMICKMEATDKVTPEELLCGYIYSLAGLLAALGKENLVDDKHIIGFQDIVRKGFERNKFVKERFEGHDDLVEEIFANSTS